MTDDQTSLRAAEFFAGIGLVRLGLEGAGVEVAWANDIEQMKLDMYAENFDAHEFVLRDISKVHGDELPDVDIATASFPCTDLSLAGYRKGLAGKQSGMFWEFTRILEQLEERRPRAILLENVPSFATSHGGKDIRAAITRMNELGYSCDVFQMDARAFVPQSRPRLFIVAALEPGDHGDYQHPCRPPQIAALYEDPQDLLLHAFDLPSPPELQLNLDDCIDRVRPRDCRWWEPERSDRFLESLSDINVARVEMMRQGNRYRWATAFRRTRAGICRWEVRTDGLAGCLRTARGGSSKQAVVQAGRGTVRVRWMTPREYAALQGAPTFKHSSVSPNQALFGYGDAVCVPVIEWIASQYLVPLASGVLSSAPAAHELVTA